MVVPDASAVTLLFADPGSDPRVSAATKILTEDPEWVVPEVWRTEVLSVFRGLLLGGKLTRRDAEQALVWLQAITVITAPTGPCLTRMWELRGNLSAYDACYVAVAESHDLTLVTADVRIAKAGVARCPVRTLN
ncbi:type II toxin-antitoxin system VapC family toxin [Nocardioides sp. NPDC047086]|uniref:type II toxin-antitoxin system VapC family toxin n=1 Tax=Nocardioides sp. NPDC047086 TaxID=3154810 RepID=UPI0034094A82